MASSNDASRLGAGPNTEVFKKMVFRLESQPFLSSANIIQKQTATKVSNVDSYSIDESF